MVVVVVVSLCQIIQTRRSIRRQRLVLLLLRPNHRLPAKVRVSIVFLAMVLKHGLSNSDPFDQTILQTQNLQEEEERFPLVLVHHHLQEDGDSETVGDVTENRGKSCGGSDPVLFGGM
ncbi:hypothetical protein LOK49_LG12G01198 [Camellia lanceoleosa]|uniref:Uncharacterized protein n=1 Tax=Camellia lanceoleosa TaxID=1840588 RepID=A0ACC0FSH7_9ERIC|nr:hypothetical protein LOK49_LG12G01198 [Camellia lanceoleosa]